MENKLEQLLNSLIEKGWKVYHRNYTKCVNVWRNCAYFMYTDEYGRPKSDIFFSLRELCVKESGLWQFVCAKGYTINVGCYHWEKWFYNIDDQNQCEADVDGFDNYGYRLIESALCDEDKLEQFLLDNIKVEGKND